MTAGGLIVLNGTTSAGKSSLARALQAQLGARGACWVVIGIDDFLGKLPAAWVAVSEAGAHAAEGVTFERVDGDVVFRAGPVGRALLSGYQHAVAALVRRGVNVIVDEVVVDDAAWAGWVDALDGLEPFWVRVDCPVEVCEARERARGDRLVGLARSQAPVVHRHPSYDVAVDTATAEPAVLAAAVLAARGSDR